MPGSSCDLVHFSVTTSPTIEPGSLNELTVWAHLQHNQREVIRRAMREARRSDIKIASKGPIKASRGTVLTVRLTIDDLSVDPDVDIIEWEGEVGNATFLVSVPVNAHPGFRKGSVSISIGSLLVTRILFALEICSEKSENQALDTIEKRIKRAFASYASEDRAKVVGRIQGIEKGAPGIDVFLDVARLRSGHRWQEEIRQEIASRDILYLFWSKAASRSVHVDWEWRCAFEMRGIEGIDPVPLVSPSEVPPPTELGSQMHFNDWILAYEGG